MICGLSDSDGVLMCDSDGVALFDGVTEFSEDFDSGDFSICEDEEEVLPSRFFNCCTIPGTITTPLTQCCEPYILRFSEVEESLVAVPTDLQARNGNYPFVHLMYEDSISGQVLIDQTVLPSIKYESILGEPYVRINHGGPASGWVKLK
jgi:hypothetical protein